MTIKAISDSVQRITALDPQQSFICEAPAGSGKTELLTQRFLTLLARVKKPEEIVAITFTRKAAGEMQDRIINALKNAAINPQPEPANEALSWRLAKQAIAADTKYQWNIVETPSRLQIMTFDSLCAGLALSLPMYSSFAAAPPTTEDASELHERAARNFIASMEEQHPWSAAVGRVLLLLDNNLQKFERLLISMLAKRDSWMPMLGAGMIAGDKDAIITEFERHLQTIHGDTVARLQTKISSSAASILFDLLDFSASNLTRSEIPSPICLCSEMSATLPQADEKGIQQWLGIAHLLLTAEGEWRKQVNVNTGFPAGEGAAEKKIFKQKKEQFKALVEILSVNVGLKDMLVEVRKLPATRYSDEQKYLLYDLLDILPVASAYLKWVFQEKNQVDFTEVSMQALHALGGMDEPSELALAMDFKIQHILVDEFQDTSPTQIELIKKLTAGWQVGDGRTLFCVGDAMQSIYSFRDANVGLFLNCLLGKLGDIPLEPIKLTTNFRSNATVVDWVNRVFTRSFPQENDPAIGAVVYSNSDPFKEADTQQGVFFDVFVGNNAQQAEAEHTVALIKQLRISKPEQRIAVLVRNRKHITQIVHGLKKAKIKYRAVELESLADQPVIEDLMALTLALACPAERIAWLAILRAPWCGLSLHDLDIIANYRAPDNRPLSLWQQLKAVLATQQNLDHCAPATQTDLFSINTSTEASHAKLSKDGLQRARRVVSVLASALENKGRKSLRQWIEGSWIALGGPACLLHDEEIKNAELYFSHIEKLNESDIYSREDALKRSVEKLRAAPDPESDDGLQIMTVHKSKGLEFDTVFIPSLDRASRSRDPELLLWHQRLDDSGEAQLLMSSITVSGRSKDAIYAYLDRQLAKREAYEACRLLYVACTRAKQGLYLSACLKPAKKAAKSDSATGPAVAPPAANSLLYPVWGALKNQLREHHDTPQNDENEPSERSAKPELPILAAPLKRLPTTWRAPDLPEKNALSAYVPFYQHANPEWPDSWNNNPARKMGTLIHQIFCSLNNDKISRWRAAIPPAEINLWRSQLISLGVPLKQIDSAIEFVSKTVTALLDDARVSWLFCHSHELRKAEYALTVVDKNEVKNITLDLFIVDRGTAWVIDYKTALPDAQENIECFLQKELKNYQPSMSLYRQAVKFLGYSEVKCALYFPVLARWIEYDEYED